MDGTLYHRLKLDASGQNDEETDFIRAGGTAIARIQEVSGVSEKLTYIYTDHLGSPYMGANSAGVVTWTDETTPYGESWGQSPADQANMPGFTGHIEDTATGLTYMQARYYDPALLRFLSNDPVPFSPARSYMFGRYTYAANDPVNLTDATGMCPNCVTAGIGAAVGGIFNGAAYALTSGDNFTWTGLGANVAEGAVVGGFIGSGAGLLTVAGAGAVSNVGSEIVTDIAASVKTGEPQGFTAAARQLMR